MVALLIGTVGGLTVAGCAAAVYVRRAMLAEAEVRTDGHF